MNKVPSFMITAQVKTFDSAVTVHVGVYTTSVDNKKQVIFRHRFHGVNGGPVTVTISSPQVASVKQKDTSKPRRPKRQNISAQHKTQSWSVNYYLTLHRQT